MNDTKGKRMSFRVGLVLGVVLMVVVLWLAYR